VTSIRDGYVRDGVEGFYAAEGVSYRNPHEDGVRAVVRSWMAELPPGRILDLACGSGEVTLALRDAGVPADDIDGADPFTGIAYRERIGRDVLPWTFADLPDAIDRRWGTVICSFALHLCEPSRLPGVLGALALASERLLVLSPHKRPVIRPGWGWNLLDERYEPDWRIRSRLFRSARTTTTT
jgi:hypothetical protein